MSNNPSTFDRILETVGGGFRTYLDYRLTRSEMDAYNALAMSQQHGQQAAHQIEQQGWINPGGVNNAMPAWLLPAGIVIFGGAIAWRLIQK